MKQVSEAAAKAARHRKFHWCRRENGFSDMPVWRVVAAKVKLPLCVVLAFVNRLEEFANADEQRGHVGQFNALEFAVALDIAEEEAARIFAALEDPVVGWIAYDHVTNFHARNPDKGDDTAIDRMRRMRKRKQNMEAIARMVAMGTLSDAARPLIEAQVLNDLDLSTALQRYAVTLRNTVTVTAEQSIVCNTAAVDNSERPDICAADGSQGLEAAGAGGLQEAALAWLMSVGKRMLVEHLNCDPGRADTYIERWRDQLKDDVALQEIIVAADKTNFTGARFHNLVTEGTRRHVNKVNLGGQTALSLPPRPSHIKRAGHG